MQELLVVLAPVVPATAVQHLLGPATAATTSDRSASAHALLRVVLAELTGTPADRHVLVRRCATCGGPHGKPVLQHPDLHVSLAGTATDVAVALSAVGPVGVDLEQVARTGFPGFDGVVLAPGESAAQPGERARLWTRKEAVLKAAGTGLAVDPRAVDVREDAVQDPVPAQLYDVPAPDGLAGAAAVLGAARPPLRVERRLLTS